MNAKLWAITYIDNSNETVGVIFSVGVDMDGATAEYLIAKSFDPTLTPEHHYDETLELNDIGLSNYVEVPETIDGFNIEVKEIVK